ncbi:acetyl-coenzyme A transporter 1-domain-containing protein [Naematelia encephala]|uniref:Acetyl-coenzyme A transporter 1-domain-containing protein n=1 Tax=Naematelia encephala TaxID=71784 RepID=A0A1Y2AFQ3_9TREE|nr:acetyl-coenzyme A transporter 1-domain-containing protein [Naematelia encephala]
MPPSTRGSKSTAVHQAETTSTSLAPPTSTAFRRSSRGRRGKSQTAESDSETLLGSSASPSPAPDTVVASTPGSLTPTKDALEVEEDPDQAEPPMLGGHLMNEKGGLRGRNVEDLLEMEEKGLLMRRTTSRDGSESGRPLSPGQRMGQEKERETRLEKIEFPQEQSAGLDNPRDRQAFALLVLLYLLQGIPLGLTFGTLPFLLKPHLSYSQLAVFALSTWPYSLKLLWSPIVDAWFVAKWGRRKSWIVPVQGIVGAGLWIIGGRVEKWLESDHLDVQFITMVFGSLILAAATQDIAVDGWALTLLSPANLSYASTAQTIGLGIGSALAFTVFLAFNSVDFSNKYFRSQPLDYGLVSLGGYLRFWAVVFILATVLLALFKTEDPVSEDDPDMDVRQVYKVMWSIVRLKNIQSFLCIHLICKFGFAVNDSVTSLKLLEKGLSKEDLAVAVLLDFPAQMIAGWLAAKWSRPSPPSSSSRHPLSGPGGGTGEVLKPWIMAFWARLIMAGVAACVVYAFPQGPVGSGYFALVVATMLLSSLSSTVQFVGITAFHTQVADPLIGGTYMTLLNTMSNLGGTWPKPLVLRSVDLLTSATCNLPQSPFSSSAPRTLGECVSDHGKSQCSSAGGICVIERDGYYIMSAVCVVLGAAVLVWIILPSVKRLQSLPMSAWRVKLPR